MIVLTSRNRFSEPMRTTTAPSLARDAYARLRADILACRLRPGEPVRINRVADGLEMSAAVVREALTRLAAEGLVTAEAQRGFHVPSLSARALVDITEARIDIECLCLSYAITRGDLEWETRIVAAHHRLARQPERSADDGNVLEQSWAAAHAEFHVSLISACCNPWLLGTRDQLFAQSERYRRLSVALQGHSRDLPSEHHALMDATLARDKDLAGDRMRAHLSLTAEILLEAGICEP
jgi:DNA-binding GntR family transcriptional regulator